MPGRRSCPPWDFLHDASLTSLQSYELSRLNHAANLRREIITLLDQWVDDATQAALARWVREDRALPRAAVAAIEAASNSSRNDLPFGDCLQLDEAPIIESGAPPKPALSGPRPQRRNAGLPSAS